MFDVAFERCDISRKLPACIGLRIWDRKCLGVGDHDDCSFYSCLYVFWLRQHLPTGSSDDHDQDCRDPETSLPWSYSSDIACEEALRVNVFPQANRGEATAFEKVLEHR